MNQRSLLFVPGDCPDRMVKALGLGADALILDLEDAVAPTRKAAAREAVGALLKEPRDHGVLLFVRINPIDSEHCRDDLALISAHRPDGLVLPKAEGARSIRSLIEHLPGPPPILPVATETPAAIFQLGSFDEGRRSSLRLDLGG
uniref:Hydroxymethylglutaryl-CoA lyase n=1 Tax=Sphingomonas sp. JE1 TaxID=1628059 RepID=A0A0D4ZZF1_9SPHN|nr:Hydroxymethylglutaryl-CoA lyase [Sphingomonas sp. JE1]